MARAGKALGALVAAIGGTVALGGLALLLYQESQKKGESKADPAAEAAARRKLLQALLEPRDPPTALKRPWAALEAANCAAGSFRLDGVLACRVFSFLSLEEAVAAGRVCKKWYGFLRALTRLREFQRPLALRGFRDGKDGRHRGHCWRFLCGADETLRRARAGSSAPSSLYQRLCEREPKSGEDIVKDIARTVIHYSAFENVTAAHQALYRVLSAYANHDTEVGYCQGQNFLAAFLLTKMEEEEAYWTFYTLMTAPEYKLRNFFRPGLPGLHVCKWQWAKLFEWFLPDLHAHFAANDIPSDAHTEWFMTLFTFAGFPRKTAARIWDLFLVDGFAAIHRVALTILYSCSDALKLMDFEGIMLFLRSLDKDSVVTDADGLIAASERFSAVDAELLQRLERAYEREQAAKESISALKF